MQKYIRVLSKERTLLLIYAFSVAGLLALYVLLGVVRDGLPAIAAPAGRAELAVLVPLSGPNAELGQAVLQVVQQTVRARQAHLEGLDVKVVGYDTEGTPEGTARAAARLAFNPATAVVIGPLDARQVLATIEVLRGEDLVVITPASTAPDLRVDQYPGLFRIPAPDNAQGRAIVDFLAQGLHRTEIFLIAEPSAYAQGVLDDFSQAVSDSSLDGGLEHRLRIVDRLDLSSGSGGAFAPPLAANLAGRIVSSNATAVVYLGGLPNARRVLETMNAAGLNLPFVGSDALNDPALLPLPGEAGPVYYTSPILSLAAVPAEQEGVLPYYALFPNGAALGTLANKPFAYETAQATWLALNALSQRKGRQAARAVVWRNLANATAPGLEGNVCFSDGQRLPRTFYVYQVTSNPGGWSRNSLVHVARFDTAEGTP